MRTDFSGVYSALLTPFDEKGKLMEKALRKMARWEVNKGLHGLYICGSTGEGIFMTTEERMRVAEIVKDEIKDDAIIMCHIGGCTNTNEGLKLAKHAAKIKVDALASIPPIYYPYSFTNIKDYYKTLSDSTDLPFFMYYIPELTGGAISNENIVEIAAFKNMKGIKFTGFDFYKLQDLINMTGGKWTALSGPDQLFLPALTMGVDGSIGSTQNCLPEILLGIYESFKRGDLQNAMKLQRRMTTACVITGKYSGMISRKMAMKFRGVDAGFCRAPLKTKLSPSEEKWLKTEWKKAFPEYSEGL
ncbi:MAG: dihydrodipicolinate synthase family protein [Candidatus Firestonebacteria bacterium]